MEQIRGDENLIDNEMICNKFQGRAKTMLDDIEVRKDAAAEPARRDLATGASLSWPGAVIRSFFDIDINFYPRLGDKEIKSVQTDLAIGQMAKEMERWKDIDPSDINLDSTIELARASLNEVKQQTEYQDQKATRLLTVTTFLTALAGAFFATFTSSYPLEVLEDFSGAWQLLLIATYVSFLVFVLSAVGGALIVFHGTRTRFKYTSKVTVDRQAGPTRSYLFFREMISVSPKGWAESFVTVTETEGHNRVGPRNDLKIRYLQNYVSESYLVAAKTADKLRYLQPAQSLLAISLRFLLVYIVLLTIITIGLESPKPPTELYKLEFVSQSSSTPLGLYLKTDDALSAPNEKSGV